MKQAILAAGAAILTVTSIPARAHGPAEHQETTTRIFERELPNAPGKSLIAAKVLYSPGGATPSL